MLMDSDVIWKRLAPWWLYLCHLFILSPHPCFTDFYFDDCSYFIPFNHSFYFFIADLYSHSNLVIYIHNLPPKHTLLIVFSLLCIFSLCKVKSGGHCNPYSTQMSPTQGPALSNVLSPLAPENYYLITFYFLQWIS